MKPPRTLTVFALLSTLLFLSIIFLWLRARHARDGLWYTTDSTRYSLHSYRGRVWFWTLSAVPTPTATVWPTPATIGPGFVVDSAPDAWYDQFNQLTPPRGPRLPQDFLDAPAQYAAAPRGFLGFRYVRNDGWYPIAQLPFNYPKAQSTAFYVPHWSLALLTGALPALWIHRTRRARSNERRGLCPTCGYDLRASPAECPECGTKRNAHRRESEARVLTRQRDPLTYQPAQHPSHQSCNTRPPQTHS